MLDEKVDLVAGDFNGARGDATTATISVSLKRPLLTAPFRCLLVPHRCGDLEEFLVSGRTFLDSSNPLILMDWNTFSTHHEALGIRLTRVATTKPGSTLTLSDGATNSFTVRNTIEGSS